MKKAFSRAFPIYPECLNCNYTNGTEVFCPDVGMGYADCGIAGSTTCEVPKNKVTEKANCPKKTEAVMALDSLNPPASFDRWYFFDLWLLPHLAFGVFVHVL